MDIPRYKFSKRSEPHLLQFFKAVAQSEDFDSNSECHDLWKHVLPMQEEVRLKINRFRNEVSDVNHTSDAEIIEIDHDSEQELNLLTKDATQLIQALNLDISTSEDIVNGICEILEARDTLPDDIMEQFTSKYSEEQLENIFKNLRDELNSDCTWKLWNSINSVDGSEKVVVQKYFIQYLVADKVLNEQDHQIQKLLITVFDTLPEEVSAMLTELLIENTNTAQLTVLKNNLNNLSEIHKTAVLRRFQESCRELTVHQLPVLTALITMHSKENLSQLIDLMYNSSKEFSNDKNFGKLLLEFLQAIGSNVVLHEAKFQHIITLHTSIFKAKIVNVFNRGLEAQKLLSQSFQL